MSLRLKFILYLVFIHILFAGLALFLLLQNRLWLLAVEAAFLLSFFCGIRIIRGLFGTLDLIRTGAEFINERDFTSRFREVGQPEMDQLIHIYNRMIDHLREERIRLQEQHYFLAKVLTASPSGIITLDFDENIAMVNPSAARLLQSSSEALMGRKLSQFKSPFADALNQLATGESKVVPVLGRRRVKCHKSEFIDRGFPRHFILMEELTEELRQSEKAAYEKLIRMMSHEVNNSVGAVNSLLHSSLHYKDQLREEDRTDFETAINVVIGRIGQLNSFMKSFADVVRIPAPKRQPCNVRELLEGISLLLLPECERRNIAWRWDILDPPGSILMDRVQMEQVFLNILKNAIEAIGVSGAITIRIGRKDERGFVLIQDTGCGFTPEVRANLFTPFFSTKENGQGIGLTMVQEILSEHHFDFSLEGEPARGTEFAIYF